MIHGFANSQKDAKKSYAKLMFNVYDIFWPHMPADYVDFFGFHWPGDHPSWTRNVPSFSTRVASATSSGEKLGRLLEMMQPEQQVILVAHSLGCRVTLACLDYLAQWASHGPGPTVRAAFLLAAAVPEKDALADAPPGNKSATFGMRHAKKYLVHYSKWDKTLMLFFQPGNWLYDKGGVAIGRSGGPQGPRWDRRVNTRFDHGDYWPAPSVAQSVVSEIYPAAARLLYEYSAEHRPRQAGYARELPVAHQTF